MTWFLAYFVVSVAAGRLWQQFFDDGKLTWGDFAVLAVEISAYVAMIGSIFVMDWGCASLS